MAFIKVILGLLGIVVFIFLIWANLMITYRKFNKHTTYSLAMFSGMLLFIFGTFVLFINYIYEEGANNVLNCVITYAIVCIPGYIELKARAKRRFDNWDNPLYKEKFFDWD